MRLGFVVNDLWAERDSYTTSRIAVAALQAGHEIWMAAVDDFSYDTDETIRIAARAPVKSHSRSIKGFMDDVRGDGARREWISAGDLDVLLLRNNPAEAPEHRAWAQMAGITFGRIAARAGTLVLNDPDGLARALNKMYFQQFPEAIRPRALITRSREKIREFVHDEGTVVIKPLLGYGGRNVFLVRDGHPENLNQMVDAVLRDGYIVAQEYLTAAAEGDKRLFLVDGKPLFHRGHYAAFQRTCRGEDMRSNRTAGGQVGRAEVTSRDLAIAEMVGPQLVQDGMFFVGLDIVGDKLMEINVFCPGGLGNAQRREGVNFSTAFVRAIERKVRERSTP